MRIERRLEHLAMGLAHGRAGGTRACASKRAARGRRASGPAQTWSCAVLRIRI